MKPKWLNKFLLFTSEQNIGENKTMDFDLEIKCDKS
jgi:hypothetical protein